LRVSFRVILVASALGLLAALSLTACGSDDEGSSSDASSVPAGSQSVDPQAPLQKQLAEGFPTPKPIEAAPPKAERYIAAGQKACKGKTPTQVVDEFLPEAKEEESFDDEQLDLISEIGKYEKSPTADFAAGQIAAGIYEATLPELQQRSGYQGCVYELAVQLRNELTGKG